MAEQKRIPVVGKRRESLGDIQWPLLHVLEAALLPQLREFTRPAEGHIFLVEFLDLWILPVGPNGKPALDATPRPYLRTPSNEGWGRFSHEAPPRWVAYQSDETGRWEVYIQAFPEPRGATRISTAGGKYPQWGAGGRELFYVAPDNKLMAVSLKMAADTVEPSTPRELFPLPAVEAGWSPYDTTPDGQRFLVRATPGQAAQPLTVIVNWPALLKREAAAQ